MLRYAMDLCATVLILCLGCQPQADLHQDAAAPIADGSTVLTTENFVRIREFILAQGRRATYCNMFNNNPYFPFRGFRAYLNPPDQGNINCELGKSEFPTLVIATPGEPGPNRYWHVHLDKSQPLLRIEQHYSKAETSVVRQEVTSFFERALAEIQEFQAGEPVIKPITETAQGTNTNVRLCIAMPDGHYYNIASDPARLGSTGDRFHDLQLSESEMSEVIQLVWHKYKLPWRQMTAVSPYPKTHTVLLLYGSAPYGMVMCTIGNAESAVPILEELLTFIPAQSVEDLRKSLGRLRTTAQASETTIAPSAH